MAISSLFAKFKGLGPAIVVGGAVLVTIKLLTTKTPTTEESLIVKVEEDIKTDPYEDKLDIPEPEPEPEPEEQPKDPASEKQEAEEDEEDEEEKETEEAGEETEEEEAEDEEESPPTPPQEQPKARKWATGGGNAKVVGVLQRLFSNGQKQ